MAARKKSNPCRLLEEHPEWENWTLDDFHAEICRLQAKIEDAEERRSRIYRQNGYVAPHDMQLFIDVCRGMRMGAQTTWRTVAEILRLRKRCGHKQQELLEAWDRWYSEGRGRLPDMATADRLEAVFESQEEAREGRVA